MFILRTHGALLPGSQNAGVIVSHMVPQVQILWTHRTCTTRMLGNLPAIDTRLFVHRQRSMRTADTNHRFECIHPMQNCFLFPLLDKCRMFPYLSSFMKCAKKTCYTPSLLVYLEMFWLILITFHGFLLPTYAIILKCSNKAIETPVLLGASIISLTATSGSLSQRRLKFAANWGILDFCNVTIIYTHPGQNDKITVQVWLPSRWNGNFYAAGGSGWETGIFTYLEEPVSKGYAAATTDGGHSSPSIFSSAEPWAQVSHGNVNMYLLQNYASVALYDLTIIGKAIITSFYSQAPKYSYWNGCSGGGRQGLMMAQRYPTTFNGILAAAPAINVSITGHTYSHPISLETSVS